MVTMTQRGAPMITVASTSGDSPDPPNNVRKPAIKHGTEWSWRRCREENGVACDACRKAKNAAWERQRQLRLGRPIPEGLEHGAYVYNNYGCGCDICVSDHRAKHAARQRAYLARKRSRDSR
jgi:hypothetical protein